MRLSCYIFIDNHYVMKEFKEGELKSGKSGKKVTKVEQAKAIALSEARQKGLKPPPKKE